MLFRSEAAMTGSRFHMAGMDCSAEEQLVRMALADVDAVHRVDVDLDGRQVMVEHATATADIDAALQSLGLGAEHVDDDVTEIGPVADSRRERNALIVALVINAGFFVGELTVGLITRSLGLVADGLDLGDRKGAVEGKGG